LFALTVLALSGGVYAGSQLLAMSAAPVASNGIVISQVYGGGGNSGSTYRNDFVELYNPGTTNVDVSGWSVQYAPATSASWQVTTLNGSIAPGHYYLVTEAAGSGGTTNLPAPDATGGILLSATRGKIALVNSATALSGNCPAGASIVDLAGYGSTANCFEGSGPTPAPSNTNSVFRKNLGCQDSGDNASDFLTGITNPRNSSSAQFTCGAATPTPTASPTPSANCGVERWSVKTGTDLDAASVNLSSATNTTIAALRSLAAPGSIPANNRVAPAETTQWVINGTLVRYKLEDDSDYHMVISDENGNTIITEIPLINCVAPGSPFAAGVANARAEFDDHFTATTSFQTVNVPVRITGPAMFDFLHGQSGVAPNGIEIHPVLDIAFVGAPSVQFSSGSYTVNEGEGRVNITLTRTGDATSSASVNFVTNDNAGLTNCNIINGTASPRCDYENTIGAVSFAAGESSKAFSVAIVDDAYHEGDETFTIGLNSPSGAALGVQSVATVTITDNDAADGANPVDNTDFFVRQQYLDFLGREPDPPGFAGWTSTINNCAPNDSNCDRIHVSQLFFQSAEFQERGYFVYRFYPVALGRKPDYSEFVSDLASVSGFLDANQLEAAKVAFINGFMARPLFASAYNPQNNNQYVLSLLGIAGVDLSSRQAMIDGLNNSSLTRAAVLRQIVESTEVSTKYNHQAYAVLEYFGYLRRQPDGAYLAWIAVLDGSNDPRGMVSGFVNSIEYRARFGK
jgi:hypothetical protein